MSSDHPNPATVAGAKNSVSSSLFFRYHYHRKSSSTSSNKLKPRTAIAAVVVARNAISSSPFFRFHYYRKRKHRISRCPDPSNTASVDAISKKTRDLPNLNECHGCQFRVDVTNGGDRLRTLYSEWRIVLLCKRCFSLVKSSQVCSYCFSEIEKAEICFHCYCCNRRIHKYCFSNYGNVAPWAYSRSLPGMSVCIDCWVPKPVACSRLNSNYGKSNSFSKLGDSGHSENIEDLGVSRVSMNVTELGNSSRVLVLESLLENVHCAGEKKVQKVDEAREMAGKKAEITRRTMEFATGASMFANKNAANGFIADAELAIQLHRAMNSSPRNVKKLMSPGRFSSNLAAPKLQLPEHNGDSSVSVCGKYQICTNNKLYEIPDESVSEPSVSVGDLHRESSTLDMKGMILGGIGNEGTSSNNAGCRVEFSIEDGNVEVLLKEGESSCSNKLNSCEDDNCSMQSNSHIYGGKDEYKQSNKPAHCFITYKRKRERGKGTSSKSSLDCKS